MDLKDSVVHAEISFVNLLERTVKAGRLIRRDHDDRPIFLEHSRWASNLDLLDEVAGDEWNMSKATIREIFEIAGKQPDDTDMNFRRILIENALSDTLLLGESFQCPFDPSFDIRSYAAISQGSVVQSIITDLPSPRVLSNDIEDDYDSQDVTHQEAVERENQRTRTMRSKLQEGVTEETALELLKAAAEDSHFQDIIQEEDPIRTKRYTIPGTGVSFCRVGKHFGWISHDENDDNNDGVYSEESGSEAQSIVNTDRRGGVKDFATSSVSKVKDKSSHRTSLEEKLEVLQISEN